MKNQTERAHRGLYTGVAILTLALTGGFHLSAATLTVTNTNDSGPGSLRDNIAIAAPGDLIQFSVTGTIQLASTLSIGATNLTISGPGASQLAISNGTIQYGPIFYIGPGSNVRISGVTVENGDFLYVNGSLYGGGAIHNDGGTLVVANSTLSNNRACCTNQGYGGAIFNNGTLTVSNSTLSGNSAQGGGGGAGGGIYNSVAGILTVTNSTLSGNSAADGGGIDNDGTLTVTNSTFSSNSATHISGGGIYSSGTLTVINGTFSGNYATDGFGGNIASSGTLSAKSTILANSRGGSCDLSGSATSLGYNLSDDASCSATFTAPTDKNDIAAGLDPQGLQNNGGPTQTIALLTGSPAVDAIPVADCTDASGNRVTTDQRGIGRPQGPACDIGAFELKTPSVPFSSFNAKLKIFGGSKHEFELNATFTLGSGSTGIDPLTEAVTLQIAGYSATIPAGSFRELQHGPKKQDYVYSGTINGVALHVCIEGFGDSSYRFKAEGSPVNLNSSEKVPVTITIGENTGTESVLPRS